MATLTVGLLYNLMDELDRKLHPYALLGMSPTVLDWVKEHAPQYGAAVVYKGWGVNKEFPHLRFPERNGVSAWDVPIAVQDIFPNDRIIVVNKQPKPELKFELIPWAENLYDYHWRFPYGIAYPPR